MSRFTDLVQLFREVETVEEAKFLVEWYKKAKDNIAEVTSYEVLDKHLQKNQNGSLLNSDHAQVVCEIKFR